MAFFEIAKQEPKLTRRIIIERLQDKALECKFWRWLGRKKIPINKFQLVKQIDALIQYKNRYGVLATGIRIDNAIEKNYGTFIFKEKQIEQNTDWNKTINQYKKKGVKF